MERIDLKRFDRIPVYAPDANRYAVKLDANESFLEPDLKLRAKIYEIVAHFDFNRYPDPLATELCRAFGRQYYIDPTLLTAGNGSDELISVVIMSLLKAGQRLLVCDPDFSMYRFYAERAGIDCITYEKSTDYEISADDVIAKAKKSDADMVIFSNPCNPTGRGMTRSEVLKLVNALSDRAVVIDEAYMDFWNQSVLDMVGTLPNLIVLRTCSKACGLAGLRVGFAAAAESVTAVLRKGKSPYNVTGLSQAIATAALDQPGYVESCIKKIVAARDKLYRGLKKLEKEYGEIITVRECRTNFVIVVSEKGKEIHEALKKRGVSIRYTEGLLRVTAGSDREIATFLTECKEVLNELAGGNV
jgi:histidinol-phosphate aminotransferase